jgi:hypothetical protein
VPGTRTENEIRELTLEQWEQLANDKTRRYFGISAQEFERRLDAGEIACRNAAAAPCRI